MKKLNDAQWEKLFASVDNLDPQIVAEASDSVRETKKADIPAKSYKVTKWVLFAAAAIGLVAVMFAGFILNGVVRERWGQPTTSGQAGGDVTTQIPSGSTTESPITTQATDTAKESEITTATEEIMSPAIRLAFTKAEDDKSWIVSKIEWLLNEDLIDYPYCVVIPAEYEGLPVTEIGAGAYKNNGTQISVALPEGITKIGAGAFSRGNLIRINIPGTVTSIEERAFYFSGLKEITISEGLKSIGEAAFFHCGLTGLILPESLESIGNAAFQNNNKLTSICIPAGVTNVGEGAFGRFTEVQVAEGNPYYVNNNGCIIDTRTHEVVAMNNNAVIPDDAGILRITSALGVGDTLYVPASVEVIGTAAIGEGDGESRLYSSVKKVIFAPGSHLIILEDSALEGGEFEELRLPDGLEVIGECAFRCCIIQKLIIPASVKSIGEEAFSNQGKYVEIIYEGTVAEWKKLAANDISDYWVECGPVICTDGTTTITGE